MKANKTKQRLFASFFICLLLANFFYFKPALAVSGVYYVSPSGNNANLGSVNAPWQTLSYAFGRMSGGDTLVLKDGTYYEMISNMPSGTASAYTILKAEHDGAAVIDGSRLTGFDLPLKIYGKSYVQIEGLNFRGGRSDSTFSGAALILGSHHIKIKRCAFYDLGTRSPDDTGNITTFATDQSQYVLVEDSYAWGAGRYKFEAHESDKVIFRRVVARHDMMDSRFPQALFSIYRSSNTHLQNVIAIDADQHQFYTGYSGFYGAIFSPNSDTTYSNNGLKVLGSIVLNIDGSAMDVPFTLSEHVVKNSVFWRTKNGSGWSYPIGANLLLDHVTIGDTYGPRVGDIEPNSGIALSGFGSGSVVRNSVIYRSNLKGVWNFGTSDYNDLYSNGENYASGWLNGQYVTPTQQGANDRFVDPGFRHITRIESSSPLKQRASDGGDIGANVIYKYGVSGTLWGDQGYEDLTTEPLWPWPYEARIGADMRGYNVGSSGPSGNRGFAQDGKTLTRYVWEYIGTPCPSEICSGTPPPPPANQRPSASITANPASGAAPLSVSFTGSGSDPDGSIAAYSWNFGDGGTSTQQNPNHTYAQAGVFTTMLTVTDNGGLTGSTTQTITVSAAPPPPPPPSGTVYYVSPYGSDADAGSQSVPWRTLQHAANTARAGAAVLVLDGTYAGFHSVNSGSTGSPITFRAQGGSVIINSRNSNTLDNINIENNDYIVIDGFKIRDSLRDGVRIANAENIVVSNSQITGNVRFGILTGFAPRVQIISNDVSYNAEHGIYISNSDAENDNPVVRGNRSYNNGQNGIQFNGDLNMGGDGLISGAIVEKNEIHNNQLKGLSFISAANSVIRNNIIYSNGITAGAGGIHIVEEPDTAVYSNNNTIVNNTVVEPRIAGLRINARNTGNIVFNNIFISPNPWAFEGSGNYIGVNVTGSSSSGLFVNAAAFDFHLAAGSRAINAGTASFQNTNAPSEDFSGAARPAGGAYDAGAYEYAGTTPPPPPPPPPSVTLHPSGTLIKTTASPAVYLVEGAAKRFIPNQYVFNSQFYSAKIVTITEAEMTSYAAGAVVPFRDGELVKANNNPAVYVFEYSRKRWITTPQVFSGMGYRSRNIISVPPDVLAQFENGPNLDSVAPTHPNGTLIKTASSSDIYVLNSGRRRLIPNRYVMNSWKYSAAKAVTVSSSEMTGYPVGGILPFKDGTLVREGRSQPIYVFEYGSKRLIPNITVFRAYSYSTSAIMNVPAGTLNPYNTGAPLS